MTRAGIARAAKTGGRTGHFLGSSHAAAAAASAVSAGNVNLPVPGASRSSPRPFQTQPCQQGCHRALVPGMIWQRRRRRRRSPCTSTGTAQHSSCRCRQASLGCDDAANGPKEHSRLLWRRMPHGRAAWCPSFSYGVDGW